MDFGEAVRACLSKYATFAGRARRSEYWWFYLFCVLVVMAGVIVDVTLLGFDPDDPAAIPVAAVLVSLPLILPSLAATVRRLHDTDRSGWWWFIGLVPLVGGLILLVFMLIRGTAGDNRFGPDPRAG